MKNHNSNHSHRVNNSQELIRDCIATYRRYEDSVRVTVALTIFLKKCPQLLDDFVLGKTLKYILNAQENNVKPDIIATYSKWTKGLIVEIKWSLSNNFQHSTKEIASMKKYTYPMQGWKEALGQQMCPDKLECHDLVLLSHSDVIGMIREVIKTLIKDEPKGYNFLRENGFALWSWGEMTDRSRKKIIRIRSEYGSLNHKDLNDLAKDKIDVPLAEYIVERNSILFIGDNPPISYVIFRLMTVLYNFIGHDPRKKEEYISLSQIQNLFDKYYPLVSPHSAPQITKDIIRGASEILAKFNYNLKSVSSEKITEVGLNSNGLWYLFERKLPRGDITKWICEKYIAFKNIEEERERKKIEREKIKQAKLEAKLKKLGPKQKGLGEWE